jgi:molecular chaperone GrpE
MKKKQTDEMDHLLELTRDLQRTRADFENYRKRAEMEKQQMMERGEEKMVLKLLPIIDTIERAISHAPGELSENQWVQGVVGLAKQLSATLAELGVNRIDAALGVQFNPHFHQAVQFDEAEGENEVIAAELQAGYMLADSVIRPAMVKVTRQ